ncbi:MAG TPA: hypothetical protein VEA15_08375 [Caulobacteraceae bacterium]|nr:hypothetical protein [Caulobacteraceae bacterium]
MNQEKLKDDFLGALDARKAERNVPAASEVETYTRAREVFAVLWAALKAWDEAIGSRTEGASVRYKFEKVSKDGVVFGRISASRPGMPALNLAFQIKHSTIWVTLGLERRVDGADDLDDLLAALKAQIVSYFL